MNTCETGECRLREREKNELCFGPSEGLRYLTESFNAEMAHQICLELGRGQWAFTFLHDQQFWVMGCY